MHTNLKFKRDNPWITYRLKAEEEIRAEEELPAEAAAEQAVQLPNPATRKNHDDPGMLDESEAAAQIEEAIEEGSSKRIDDPIQDVPHADGHDPTVDAGRRDPPRKEDRDHPA